MGLKTAQILTTPEAYDEHGNKMDELDFEIEDGYYDEWGDYHSKTGIESDTQLILHKYKYICDIIQSTEYAANLLNSRVREAIGAKPKKRRRTVC